MEETQGYSVYVMRWVSNSETYSTHVVSLIQGLLKLPCVKTSVKVLSFEVKLWCQGSIVEVF